MLRAVTHEAAHAIVDRRAAILANATFAFERRAVRSLAVRSRYGVVTVAGGAGDAFARSDIASIARRTVRVSGAAALACLAVGVAYVGLAFLGLDRASIRAARAVVVAGGREGFDAVAANLIAAGHVGTRPGEGRSPTTLQKLAGLRSEPPISVPSASGSMPQARATAPPPLLPPHVFVTS